MAMTLGTRALVAIRTRPQLSGTGLGFLFWTTFLIALEPDAISRSLNGGSILTLGGETARIIGAGLLGAAASPATALLVVRYPIAEGRLVRRAALHFGGALILALALVVIAHGLAWIFLGGQPCTPASLGRDVASNWLLLTFCVAAFDGLLHALRGRGDTTVPQRQASMRDDDRTIDLPAAIPQEFCVRKGGRLTRVAVADVLLVQAQGNYVVLHAGGVRHLVREPLASVEARLAPVGFLRVHRSALVALRHVHSVQRLSSGDAMALLVDGSERKVSRTYAKSLIDALTAAGC